MKIAIFNQTCTRAGHRAWQIEDNEDWDNDDVLVVDGTEAELLQRSRDLEAMSAQAGAGPDLFYRRAAQTIREALA